VHQLEHQPVVDFYSGIVQPAIGVPINLFTGIFALARTAGGSPSSTKCWPAPTAKSAAHANSTPAQRAKRSADQAARLPGTRIAAGFVRSGLAECCTNSTHKLLDVA